MSHKILVVQKSVLAISLLFLTQPLLFAQDAEAMLKAELEREWQVVILPFTSDDSEVVRSSPLVKSLPNIIQENLSFLRQRQLHEDEYAGYIKILEENYADAEITPDNVPRERSISYSVSDIGTQLLKQLYFSSLREYLENDAPFSPSLINRIREETNADLFITGNVRVQDQYVFIDFLIISPYAGSEDGIAALSQNVFSLRSIEALSEVQRYIIWDMGKDIYNAPAGRLELGAPPAELMVRVYIDNEYRGTAPLFVAPLPIGIHTIELFAGKERLRSGEITIVENETLELGIPYAKVIAPQFALSTIPSGLAVHRDSSLLGYTPLLVDRIEDTNYLQLSGDEVRDSYVQIDENTPNFLSIGVPSNVVDVKAQLAIDREQFYASLGLTLVSGILPLFMSGITRDRNAVDTSGWSTEQKRTFIGETLIVQSINLSGLLLTIIGLVNTLDELFDYLASAETARSLIKPEI